VQSDDNQADQGHHCTIIFKNKTAFLLDLKVKIAVEKNGWHEFLHQGGRDILEGK
jgi:hypothetical protein